MKVRSVRSITIKASGTIAAGAAALLLGCSLVQADFEQPGSAARAMSMPNTFMNNSIPAPYPAQVGNYGIRGAMQATTFTLTQVRAQVFSPNGDNRNDRAEFMFENPRDANPAGKIYDLYGAVVAELKNGDTYGSLIWDGTTLSGSTALPGVYVYQIEVTGSESKVISGVVVLAK